MNKNILLFVVAVFLSCANWFVVLKTSAKSEYRVPLHIPDQSQVEPNKPTPNNPEPVAPKKLWGDDVVWETYAKQKTKSNSRWGKVLTDIEEHLPNKYGTQYNDPDLITHGHETSHGIASELRNTHSGVNGFYCLNNKAAFVKEPKLTLSQITSRVPSVLRKSRYDTYLVAQRRYWDDTPTYLLDEWIAYINGAEVGIDQYNNVSKGRDDGTSSDMIIAPVEFSYYVLALCKTIDELDPNYADMKQFKEFVAYNLRRTAEVYKAGIGLPPFRWDTGLIDSFQASELKAVAIKWYGQDFVDKYLLIK